MLWLKKIGDKVGFLVGYSTRDRIPKSRTVHRNRGHLVTPAFAKHFLKEYHYTGLLMALSIMIKFCYFMLMLSFKT